MSTTLTPGSVRYWGPTGLTGTLAATAVAFLFAATATAPAHARPAPDPDAPTVATIDTREAGTYNCFMGQSRWPADMGQQPQCTVAQRTASQPVVTRFATSSS